MRWLVLLLLFLPLRAVAGTLVATPGTLQSVLGQAQAGDTVALQRGHYGVLHCAGQCAAGITLAGSSGVTFSALQFSGSRTRNITVQGVTVTGGHGDGIWISRGAGQIHVQDTEVRNASAHGVHIPSASIGGNTFVRVNVHDNGRRPHFDHGFYVSAANNRILDSQIHHNAAYGVHIYNGGVAGADHNVVEGNAIYANGRLGGTAYGILLSDGVGNIARKNLLSDNGTGAIYVMRAPGTVLDGNGTNEPIDAPGVAVTPASTATPPQQAPPLVMLPVPTDRQPNLSLLPGGIPPLPTQTFTSG